MGTKISLTKCEIHFIPHIETKNDSGPGKSFRSYLNSFVINVDDLPEKIKSEIKAVCLNAFMENGGIQ